MKNGLACLLHLVFLAASAQGQPGSVLADILGPEDGVLNLPAPEILCVDILTVHSPAWSWVAGGTRAVAQNGATLRYALDPNTGSPVLFNPGTTDRFVTFLSKAWPRDANGRFTDRGAVPSGGYSPTGPTPTANASEINVSYFASPPPTDGSPGVNGYVFRVAINLPAGHTAAEYALHMNMPPPADAILVSTGGQPGDQGTIEAWLQNSNPWAIDWYVSPIPEPASLLCVVCACALGRLRR